MAAVHWLPERLRFFATEFCDFAPVMALAKHCQVQPWVIAVAAGLWALGFLLWGFTGELVCSVAAYVYPTYASFKAVEGGDPSKTSGWLIYWITLFVLLMIEALVFRLVSILPGYYLMKLIFILGLSVPNAGGAQQLYAWVLRPFLLGHQPAVDEVLRRSFANFDVGIGKRATSWMRTAAVAAAVVQSHAKPAGAAAEQELQRASVVQLGKIRAAAAAAEGTATGSADTKDHPARTSRPAARHAGARGRVASPAFNVAQIKGRPGLLLDDEADADTTDGWQCEPGGAW